MKIGMLTDCYRPIINGVTNCVVLCKREMEKVGHHVCVFTFGHLDYLDREPGIYRSPGIPIADSGYYFNLEYSIAARAALKEMDVLHIHHPFTSGQAGLRHGKRHKQPIVFTNHTRYDLYAETYFPKAPPDLVNLVLHRYIAAFTADCNLIIAPSKGLRDVALSWGVRDDMVVIPNGVDLQSLRSPKSSVTRDELGIPEQATLFVYSGRLSPEKNIDLLLDAFGRAFLSAPDVDLLLIGGGPLEESLRARAELSGQIHLTGWVEPELIPAFLALGDCFVTASVTEVHPLVVLEAIGAGLPVLGIRSPGISDTVRDGVDGILTEMDAAEFADAILCLIRDRDLRDELARAALLRSQDFDIQVTVAALLEQYKRLLESS